MKYLVALTRDIEADMTESPRFVVLEASSVEYAQDVPLVFRDARGDVVAVFRHYCWAYFALEGATQEFRE